MKKNLCIVVLAGALLSLSACAQKGPVLLEGVKYQVP
ncbi:MAG: hypothetical protein H6Q97_663, partial [Nitrospirae bacterium]|nr:hypothetical protein [Nitrospirota bacterium]